jgi:hypothetical protein
MPKQTALDAYLARTAAISAKLERRQQLADGRWIDFSLFRDSQRVIYLDAEVSDCALCLMWAST